jgi:argininosuccinate lyase
MKLWAGRLSGEVDERLSKLNASIGFDQRMYREDIQGSIAHAEMLGAVGILSREECAAIVGGLEQIRGEIESGALAIDPGAEDIHTFVEGELTARIGAPGKKLHTARSRNDQVALDLRLHLTGSIAGIKAAAKGLIGVILEVAKGHLETIMPGYTHLQRAQPVTLAHHLMAYASMLLRDIDRLSDCDRRTRVSPLGAGALAGTTYPIDRMDTARRLGFSGIAINSMDAVSDRDFALELLSDLSILMMHLSRFCEEIALWCSWEYRFVTLGDQFSTGSSIMPQKKNPDIAELVRGKTGRVYGALIALLTTMKALPLAYNKDMQEDKEAVFDAVDTALLCLEVFAPMLKSAVFHPERMRAAAAAGFLNATDCADYLAKKGVPFRDAYNITGKLVNTCIQSGVTLETLPLSDYRAAHPAFDEDVYAAIDLARCVRLRRVDGGPAPEAVQRQIALVKERLEDV